MNNNNLTNSMLTNNNNNPGSSGNLNTVKPGNNPGKNLIKN